jgi:hypothetical protein
MRRGFRSKYETAGRLDGKMRESFGEVLHAMREAAVPYHAAL